MGKGSHYWGHLEIPLMELKKRKGFFCLSSKFRNFQLNMKHEQKQWLVVGWKFSTGVNSKTLYLKLFEPWSKVHCLVHVFCWFWWHLKKKTVEKDSFKSKNMKNYEKKTIVWPKRGVTSFLPEPRKKPWLVGLYRGLNYPIIWGLQ